ncbi:MAG: Benzoate transport, inner-membrane translocator precursor, partial [uncultured Craurococcus sp.]
GADRQVPRPARRHPLRLRLLAGPGHVHSRRLVGDGLHPADHARPRQRLLAVPGLRLVLLPRDHRALADVPRGLWRDGKPHPDDRRGAGGLHGGDPGHLRRAADQPWPTLVAVPAAGDPDRGGLRHGRGRAGGAHRGHLHHHDHPCDRQRLLLLHPPELRDLQWLQRLQPGGAAAGPRHRLAAADRLLLPRPRLRGAVLPRRRLCRALALRPRPAGHPRQSEADGGDGFQRRRAPDRRLWLRRRHRSHRRHPPRLAEHPGRRLHRGDRGGDRHPDHCRDRRVAPPDRALRRRLHLRAARHLQPGCSVRLRPVERALQAADRARLPRDGVLLPRWRAGAVGPLAGGAPQAGRSPHRPGAPGQRAV